MRVSLLYTAALTALLSINQSAAQCANSRASCPATADTVPTPWFNLNFATDPRSAPSIGNAGYGWVDSVTGDSCSAFHQGVASFGGSTNASNSLGPHIDLMSSTGSYSAGVALPGIIGGASSGSFIEGTNGWSMEIVVRPVIEGPGARWSKFVDMGTSGQLNGRACNGDWLFGWQDNTDAVSFSTCADGDEHKIERFIPSAPDNTWMHLTSVVQYSPHGYATYSVYYDGVLMDTREDSNNLVPVIRDRAYLARATWNDAYYNGYIDHFSIYDIALTPTHVRSLFNEKMNGCTVTRSPYTNTTVPAPTGAVSPLFTTEFTSDITRAPGVPADFGWMAQDPEDVPCNVQSQHQGLLKLAGDADWTPSISAGPFVNLSATAGENYIGQTMPAFGNITANNGSISDMSAGFSIEVSFKASFQNPYSKVWALGNSDGTSPVPGDLWAGWKGSDYALEIMYGNSRNQGRVIVSRGVPLKLRTWYHLVLSVSAQPDGRATWRVFLNGQLVVVVGNQDMLRSIPRKHSLLGRSIFYGSQDTYFSGMVDKFVVYPRALSLPQVSALATASGITSCPQVNSTLTTVPQSAVLFNASWASDPRPANANYGWINVDTNDTIADQAIHTGMIQLGTGAGGRNPGQYINLTATSGPNSASGLALGWIGGEGTGDFNRGTKGWTFETTFKILPTGSTVFDPVSKNITTTNGMGWAKLLDFGDGNKNGNCENDLVYGWNSGDPWMKFQSCNTVGSEQSVGTIAQRTMKVNFWYHMVTTLQLAPEGAWASYWLNGELIERTLIRSYPLYASRQDGRIGGSSWGADPFFNGMLEQLTIYSQSVNQQQVNYMYAVAFKLPLPNVSSSSSSSSSSSTGVSSSSSTGTSSPNTVSSSTGADDANTAVSVSMSIMSVIMVIVAAMMM